MPGGDETGSRGPMPDASIRILICDDHPVVRTCLRGMLEGQADFEVVGEAENGEQAAELVGRYRPEVMLMDLGLPQLDGVSAPAGIGQRCSDAHVVVLTSSDSGSDTLRAV